MAHSALVSLMNTLELILHSDKFHSFHVKQYVLSFYRKARFLQTLFQDSPGKSIKEEMSSLDTVIRDAAYKIENMVESLTGEQIISDFHGEDSSPKEYEDLEKAILEINSIVEELLKDRCGLKGLLPRKYKLPTGGSSRSAHSGKSMMVGFDEDVIELKDRLMGRESELQTIPIVGMGGTGKTTLARNLYDDLHVKEHFDICAWVTISQTYVESHVHKGLLRCIGVAVKDDEGKENEDEQKENEHIREFTESLYKNLKGRRYFIVLDDLWSTKVWYDLRMFFPNDGNGSRIMLTTRLMDMAICTTNSSSPPHQMRLLNHDKSWELLCREVFGQEGCPLEFKELEDIGKMIARNCKGLPLATSVIGGLLARLSKTREFWEYVADNVNSIAIRSDEHCSEIISLSYNHLPHHLQPCLLYFGVFPEDYEIPVKKLIRLWIGAGFLKPIRSKLLEEVAKEYLKDLIDRNLVFIRSSGSNGKMKTCGIHDLVRDLCIKEARNENFLHIIHDDPSSRDRRHHPGATNLHDIKFSESWTSVRSLLASIDHNRFAFEFIPSFTLLRVLELFKIGLYRFPHEILRLVNLRYMAFHLYCDAYVPPEMSSLLYKLQVLIIEDHWIFDRLKSRFLRQSPYHEVHVPLEILQMAQLRHLNMTLFFLPDPIDKSNDPVIQKDLETLCTVANFRCTEEVLKKFPNLRKLSLYYYVAQIEDWSDYHLENLVRFSKLEKLKCSFSSAPGHDLSRDRIFPNSLKKLTLSFSMLDWKDMTIIGSLRFLEVLKLKDHAFWDVYWETNEGEFQQLKFLQIELANIATWIAEKTHFPCLEKLVIRSCRNLKEIPSGIGEIETLKMIEIDNSSFAAAYSAKQILEEQRSFENYDLQVHFRREEEFSKFTWKKEFWESNFSHNKERFLKSLAMEKAMMAAAMQERSGDEQGRQSR